MLRDLYQYLKLNLIELNLKLSNGRPFLEILEKFLIK